MTYHSHRFEDHSLVVYQSKKLLAIFPAHKFKNELRSHWGLTYGGIYFRISTSQSEKEAIWLEIIDFLKKAKFLSIKVKEVPRFYLDKNLIKWEDSFYSDWQVLHSERVFAIDYRKEFQIHKTKLKHYKRNQNLGFKIEASSDFSEFWNQVLIPRLNSRYGVKPVHSLSEIDLLATRFPEKIIQYNLRLNDEILAGITLFDKGLVVKSQYGATTEKGQKYRALEFLFIHLIYKYQQQGKSYFSMGTIGDKNFTEGFNPGLKKQKEELGCKEYVQHFYTFDLS